LHRPSAAAGEALLSLRRQTAPRAAAAHMKRKTSKRSSSLPKRTRGASASHGPEPEAHHAPVVEVADADEMDADTPDAPPVGGCVEDAVYNLVKVEDTSEDPPDFKYYFSKDGFGPINPLHDIPLYADEEAGILNMVVEIPRGTNAKLEIKTKEPLAPIVQDRKKGKPRYVANVYPYSGYLTTYGYLCQTYEDPAHAHMETGALGDGDPLDVCNISDRPTRIGDVLQVKVLGVLGMIDEGEMDWKVIVINADDPMCERLHDVDDLYRLLPGLIHATFSWFRTYKVPDGKEHNVFAFREQVQPRAYAMDIIEECYESWRKIVTGEVTDKNHDPMNTTLEYSKFRVAPEEARAVINKVIAEFAEKASKSEHASKTLGRSGSWLDMTHIPPPEFETLLDDDISSMKPMMTIKRFCTELQRKFPHGSNDLSLLITELGVAFKCVRAQLCDAPNTSFSALQSFANAQIHASLASSGLCCLIYSSTSPQPMELEPGTDVGNYIVTFNPLCGDPGSSLGSVFSVYYRKSAPGKEGDMADLLQRPGYDQVAAGYCLYGSSTFLTFSMGYGVNMFSLDIISGHFVLAKQHIHTPANGPLYSIDTSVLPSVVSGVRKFVNELEAGENRKFRHTNNLVANFHNVLIHGGILMLPGPQKQDLGKFLTEAAPLAFVARQAGGRASVGKRHLLELSAWSLEMSVPLFVGSSLAVDRVEEFVLGHAIEEKNKVDPSTVHHVV
jgi:inorganic pyrophosphatase